MNWRPDLFEPPALERRSEIHSGMVFQYAGRPLCVVRAYGTDAAAPVIVEEMAEFGTTLRGQLSLWSAGNIARVLAGRNR